MLLNLHEMYNTLQLSVFFSFYFSFLQQLSSGLWDWKLLFLILKISHCGRLRSWVKLFQRYSCKNYYENWYLPFRETCVHKIWQTGTSRGVASNETNQVGTGDIISSRSQDKLNISPWPVYLWLQNLGGW